MLRFYGKNGPCRVLGLVVTAVLSLTIVTACTDSTGLRFSATHALQTVNPGPTFTLSGESFWWNGQITTRPADKSLCSRTVVVFHSSDPAYPNDSAYVEKSCGTPILSDPGGYQEYDGGFAEVSATALSGMVNFLGSVSGDLSQEAKVISVPADATLSFSATPYGCWLFSGWRTGSGQIVSTANPWVQSAGSAAVMYTARFVRDRTFGC